VGIQIEKVRADEYRVTVQEGGSESAHAVTAPPDYVQKLTAGKADAETLIRRSFEFLLEREPKESILARFELPVIARYFPEYEQEIRKRLSR
jgi:hypothetical protein